MEMSNNYISDSELLQFAIESGMINPVIAAQKYEMANRQKLLDQHKGKIWLAKDGYWKTKVPKGDGSKDKRLIKKRNRSDVENEIIKHYETLSQKDLRFKHKFDAWVERQKICGRSENTILKYESDYRRFFEGYPIEQYNINEIDEEVLSEHIKQVLEDKKIRWLALKDIMGYVNGVFEKAVRDRTIIENPCKYIDLMMFKRFCYMPPVKTTSERTLSDKDIHTLIYNIQHPKAANVNYISCFAIEMALYTGMRVGELSALMWEDVILSEGIMVIRHSEKYDRISRKSYVTITKNGKERVFPITPEITDLLKRIVDYETDRGWQGDFVFQDSKGRLTKSKISDSMRNHTMSNEFSGVKSIHAIRRTINSKMKCNGVSATIASSLLGHTERVNDSNYTYDISDMDTKRAIVTSIVT